MLNKCIKSYDYIVNFLQNQDPYGKLVHFFESFDDSEYCKDIDAYIQEHHTFMLNFSTDLTSKLDIVEKVLVSDIRMK